MNWDFLMGMLIGGSMGVVGLFILLIARGVL